MNANTIELINQIERRTVLVYDLETMAQLTNRNVTEVYIKDSATFVEKDVPIEAIYILVEGEMQVINIFENGSMYKFASIKQYETENRPVLILRQKRLEVAEHLGLSERTINRTILKLKQEGLINVTSGKVKISRENFDRLKKYLDLKGSDVS